MVLSVVLIVISVASVFLNFEEYRDIDIYLLYGSILGMSIILLLGLKNTLIDVFFTFFTMIFMYIFSKKSFLKKLLAKTDRG
ncbi:hypothetical protein LZ906_017635 (plasmid) [Paraclostridium ghonii]|uniref:hypothetical protein n=1 Tax=Paraclostridium ghonii TaxID=29358 RepID=UPI00202CE4C7|nr:hypothetical protein [Paeniclostridium ghonii]MCM0165674.1 hypothetical protein [Paeniclostridium ghonii]